MPAKNLTKTCEQNPEQPDTKETGNTSDAAQPQPKNLTGNSSDDGSDKF